MFRTIVPITLISCGSLGTIYFDEFRFSRSEHCTQSWQSMRLRRVEGQKHRLFSESHFVGEGSLENQWKSDVGADDRGCRAHDRVQLLSTTGENLPTFAHIQMNRESVKRKTILKIPAFLVCDGSTTDNNNRQHRLALRMLPFKNLRTSQNLQKTNSSY